MAQIVKPKARRKAKRKSSKPTTPAKMAYYAGPKGTITYKPKMGKTSAKNPVLRRLNAFEGTQPGVYVKHVYSGKSRVIRGTDSMTAVKLSSGQIGWINERGAFIQRDRLRELFHNIDQTSPASISDVSLLDMWDAMPESAKAKLADYMQDFDWDVFWEEIGSDDPERDLTKATDAYFELIEDIGKAMGW